MKGCAGLTIYAFLNEIVLAFVESGTFFLFYIFLIGKKNFISAHKLKTIIILSINFLFSYYTFKYIPIGIYDILYYIFMIAFFGFVTKSNIFSSAISISIVFILNSVFAILLIQVSMLILHVDFGVLMYNEKVKFVITLILRSLEILVLILVYKSKCLKIPFLTTSFFSKDNYFLSYFILQIVALSFALTATLNNSKSFIIQLFILSFYLILCILGLLDIKERLKVTGLEKKYIAQSEYVRNMETVMKVIRKEKHDLNNHLSILIMLCQQRNEDTLDRVVEYSKKLLELPNISDYKFYNTGNIFMDGLLAVKNNIAAENGIHFEADFEETLDQTFVDPIDLTSILGNILDNALDTHILSPNGNPNPIVSIYAFRSLEKGALDISISNNGIPIPEDHLKKIFTENFTTKGDATRKERGFGLTIVEQLVRKNKGSIAVKSDETGTEFLVSLPVKEKKPSEPSL